MVLNVGNIGQILHTHGFIEYISATFTSTSHLPSLKHPSCLPAGGAGKSTLAKILFNWLAEGFAHSAFVEIQQGDGPDKNATHLAAALKSLGASGEAAEGAAVLSDKLERFLESNKVLLVLDNVWTDVQLTALLPPKAAWKTGSTVIITSRSSRINCDAWREVRPPSQYGLQTTSVCTQLGNSIVLCRQHLL
jgi:hypothetical protein